MKHRRSFARIIDRTLNSDSITQKWGFAISAWVIYIALFFFTKANPKEPWVALAAIPAGIFGWYFGAANGAIAAILYLTIDIGILSLIDKFTFSEILIFSNAPETLALIVIVIIIAIITGIMGKMYRKQYSHLQETEKSEEEQRLQVEFLSLLNSITRSALETNDLETMLDLATKGISVLNYADDCIIILFKDGTSSPRLIAMQGSSKKAIKSWDFEKNKCQLLDALLKDTGPMAIEDIQETNLINPGLLSRILVQSLIAIPLEVDQKTIGGLILGYNKKVRFSNGNIKDAVVAANQVALAIAKIDLLEQAHKQLKQLSGLHELSKTYSASLDIFLVYSLLTEKLATLINASKCYIALIDPIKGTLQAQHPGYGLGSDTLTTMRFPVSSMKVLWPSEQDEVFWANDPDNLPEELGDIKRALKVSSIMLVPLRARGQLLGMLLAANKLGGFTPEDEQLMGIFSGQAAAVIQSVKLIETTTKRARNQSALLELSTLLVNALDKKEICKKVVSNIDSELGYKHIALYLVNSKTGKYELQASIGWTMPADSDGNTPGKRLHLQAFLKNKLIYTPNTGERSEHLDERHGSLIDVPLRINGKASGVLVIESELQDAFSQSDFEMLSAVANLTSLALTKSESVLAEQRQFGKLQVLNVVAQATTNARDEDELIEKITQIIGDSLCANNFGIVLLNEHEDILYPHVSYHLPPLAKNNAIRPGVGIIGQVALTGNSKNIPDVQKFDSAVEMNTQTRSVLCVPLQAGKQIIGVINTESSKVAAFSEEDEQLLLTLAGHLTSAIVRLRISTTERKWFSQIVRSNTLMSALSQVATKLEIENDVDGIMQLMGRELKKLGYSILIGLFNPASSKLNLQYTSLEPEVIHEIKRISELDSLSVPLEMLVQLANNKKQNLKPIILSDPITGFEEIFEKLSKADVKKILDLMGIKETMNTSVLPLLVKEKIVGFIWLWGSDLHQSDLSAIHIFASQAATAIENARLFAEVQQLAIIDDLTDLFNRRRLFELANQECARSTRYGRFVTILMIDLDHFKCVNDEYGHLVGDEVLRNVAQVMKTHMRAPDILGRYGGEEFMAVLPETNAKGGLVVAERLRTAVAQAIVATPGRKKVKVTISVGVAARDDFSPDLETLIARADQALYVAKFKGRNQVAYGS
ncbi:MAG: diguanylate cyclase [Anaerolineales bacterium]|nr:diguanylate cyclase [Anaerolineales bacterium]